MRKIGVIILGIFLFISGCVTLSVKKMNQLELGMTKEEVIGIMGHPTSISAKGDMQYLNYLLLADDGSSENIYFVRLVNGKVDAYGKKGDFDSTKDPTVVLKTDENIKHNDVSFSAKMRELKSLADDGTISKEEFNMQKQKLYQIYFDSKPNQPTGM